ncbi:MAG: trypsin-like serine protease [Acidobacteria bacterium]|nr:trypsin-like serine protease [Acidobacteriota bacterium]
MRDARPRPRAGRLVLPFAALSILPAIVAAACAPGPLPPPPAHRTAAPLPSAGQPQRALPPIPADLRPDERATVELFERTSPSVVYITTLARRTDWFGRPMGGEVPQGTGTGFVWDDDGHVITNAHVVRGAEAVEVVMADQTTYDAEWVGGSATHDLAVLRIEAPAAALRPVTIGASDRLRVGQRVYAIGNPFGLSATLTTGIVSALGRRIEGLDGTPIEDVIQTDAAINTGNSGGPLLDSGGRLIGVNTQIASPSGASAGVGFAVPVNTVSRVVPQIIDTGEYTPPRLGIRMDGRGYLSRYVLGRLRASGVLVVGTERGGGAAAAGLRGTELSRNGRQVTQVGAVIQAVDGERIRSQGELRAVLDRYSPGDDVTVTILRDGDTLDVVVPLS